MTDPVAAPSYRTSTTELSATVRRRTRELGELRTRLARLTRATNAPDSPLQQVVEDFADVAAGLLQDLAGADMDAHRRLNETRAERERADYLLAQVPVPCIVADADGTILQANPPAAALMNVSARHLAQQRLLHFSQDREAFLLLLERLRHDATAAECKLVIRPRERQPLSVLASVRPAAGGAPGEWLWFFTAEPAVRPTAARRGARGRPAPSTWPAPPASTPAHS